MVPVPYLNTAGRRSPGRLTRNLLKENVPGSRRCCRGPGEGQCAAVSLHFCNISCDVTSPDCVHPPRIMCCPVFVPHSRGRGPAPEWAENWAVRHWVRAVARESADTRELGPDTENVSKLSRNWQMSGVLRHICKVSSDHIWNAVLSP